MAFSGPPPKPTKLKALAGTLRKNRTNSDEPEYTPTRKAVPPTDLDPLALLEWNRLTAECEKNGLLTEPDLVSLAVYCRSWSMYVEASEFIAENGQYYETSNKMGEKYFAMYPQVTVMDRMSKTIDKYAQKFGFTPADRTRIKANLNGIQTNDGEPEPATPFARSAKRAR